MTVQKYADCGKLGRKREKMMTVEKISEGMATVEKHICKD